jgi:uncharacterized damage-inducible protein DinB
MQELIDLYRYNARANDRVFAVAEGVAPPLLDMAAPGTRDTVKATLVHLARVEYFYLALIQGQSRASLSSPREPEPDDLATMRRQHRSQVLSWLSAQGVATPDLDYVLMLDEQRSSPPGSLHEQGR